MKKIFLIAIILATSTIADNARCEGLLAEIRANSNKLTMHYNNGNNARTQQVMRESFKIATQAMFVCEDERNLDSLEDILNKLGVFRISLIEARISAF